MSTRLFSTKDRDESHRKLEEVLASGDYPRAECREADEEGNYTVWDGPHQKVAEEPPPPPTVESVVAGLNEEQLDRLADLIAKKMKGG